MSIDKSTLLKTFNTHFFEFLDDVADILPENQEIKIARTSFDTIRRANPTIIAKVWYSHIYSPYASVFDSGNVEFFLDKDYTTDLHSVSNSGRVLEMIDKIRGPIKNMTPENLEHSKKYITNLCKLSILYNG
jgi:hypothetical protein